MVEVGLEDVSLLLVQGVAPIEIIKLGGAETFAASSPRYRHTVHD